MFGWWPAKIEAKNRARRPDGYECGGCKQIVLKVDIDHISPVMDPEKGFTTWDEYIQRLLCEAENLVALCKECHTAKSKDEARTRAKHKTGPYSAKAKAERKKRRNARNRTKGEIDQLNAARANHHKPVRVTNLLTGVVTDYGSISQAASECGVSRSRFYNALFERSNKTGNFLIEYIAPPSKEEKEK